MCFYGATRSLLLCCDIHVLETSNQVCKVCQTLLWLQRQISMLIIYLYCYNPYCQINMTCLSNHLCCHPKWITRNTLLSLKNSTRWPIRSKPKSATQKRATKASGLWSQYCVWFQGPPFSISPISPWAYQNLLSVAAHWFSTIFWWMTIGCVDICRTRNERDKVDSCDLFLLQLDDLNFHHTLRSKRVCTNNLSKR